MTFELTDQEGVYLVKLARKSIEASFKGEKVTLEDTPEKLRGRFGVFVTLNEVKDGEETLRGCIGYPLPIKPLIEAINEVSKAAAFEDPRFNPIQWGEWPDVSIEVSILTPPEVIIVESQRDLPRGIKVGSDGLIARRGGRSGLLLPQVATDWEWGSEEFLSQTCIKAGLPPDAWLIPGTEVSKFQAIIFAEDSPGGAIKRKKLHYG